jgi:apolipoprotein N-acyltransferase
MLWPSSSKLAERYTRPAFLNAASFSLGIIMVLGYAPFSFWLVPLISLTLWLSLLHKQSVKRVSQASFCFGLGWFGVGISWVFVSIDQFGGLPVLVSIVLMLLLSAYLALYPTLACYLSTRFSRNQQFQPWLLPCTWLLAEYLRSVMLTGFPWLSIGYSQINGPLASFAPLIGETGISFILICLASALSQIVRGNALKHQLLALCLLVLVILIVQRQTWVHLTGTSVKTALLQGNIAQDLKWQPEQEWPTMQKYAALTRAHYDAELIIWPESAIPRLEPMAQEFLALIDQAALLNQTSIITGIQTYEFDTKDYFNSLIVLGKKQASDSHTSYFYRNNNRYYKHHLLPIGEFVPFQQWLRPIAPLFNLPMSSFSRGAYVQQNLIANGLHILPLLCFEIAFPEQLKANFHHDTQLILTVSNDAWFGDSHGPHQHLEIAQMRALEFGRPVLRDTNNGVTAVIDHQGQVINRLPQFSEAVLRTTVPLTTGRTPFSRYGHWPSTLLALFLLLARLVICRKSNTN